MAEKSFVNLQMVGDVILATVVADVHHSNGSGKLVADFSQQFSKIFGAKIEPVNTTVNLSFKGAAGAGARFAEYEKNANPASCVKGAFSGALEAGKNGEYVLNVIDWAPRFNSEVVPNTTI